MAEPFENVIRAISSADEPLTAATMYRLSDINSEDLGKLQAAWGAIPVERRLVLVQRLGEIAEMNFDMNFSAVIRLALTDLNAELREAAIDATWIDESPDMLNRLLPLTRDMSDAVRASAVAALGRYILLGELGKFDAGLTRLAQNVARRLYADAAQPISVRRRALESLSNCSDPDVHSMIDESYAHSDAAMRISAMFAMGRSCDSVWAPIVLRELDSADPEMRYEAARTAGELELRDAVPALARIINDDDREVQEMAIWALGEIGGTRCQRLLEDLIEQAEADEDDGLVEAIEEALNAASLVGEGLIED